MVNPDELVEAVRDKLRAIPAVVSMVDSDANRITGYGDNVVTLGAAVIDAPSPSIIVAWVGNEPGEEGLHPWIQIITLYLRLNSRMGLAFANICDSVATGDTLKFTETEFHDDFELLGIPVFGREVDDDGVEYPQITMRFRQRSQE